MNTYSIQVNDSSGNPIPGAIVYLLDGPDGNGIMIGSTPAAFVTDANGSYTYTNALPEAYVRATATGYPSKNAVLKPGANTIALTEPTLAEATVTASRTFFNKYKVLILIVLAVALIFAAIKFKVLK